MFIVSDEDIRRVTARLGVAIPDNDTLSALSDGASCDVQSAPGAGKTTIVAAKVALLLESTNRSGGVCVLSHTNVAKNEIIERLAKVGGSGDVLQSPHFIGTIQSFVQTFFALPYLRATNKPFHQIDDDAFASAADALLATASMARARFALSKRENLKDVHRFLEWEPRGNEIHADRVALPGKATDTYRSLKELKGQLSDRGVYRYRDVYHFAHRYLDEQPAALMALHRRFPFVLVDEAQDCDEAQMDLIDRLFPPERVVIQRFGDDNQAIFSREGSDGATSFPSRRTLKLGDSQRFGDFIADQVCKIAPNRQRILGSPALRGQPEAPHTIFIFTDDSIELVIPAFGRLAKRHFSGREDIVAKAIGHKKMTGGSTKPRAIVDYFKSYAPGGGVTVKGSPSFRLRVERARRLGVSDLPAGTAAVLAAIRELVTRWAGADLGTERLNEARNDVRTRKELGEAILGFLQDRPEREVYEQRVVALCKLLKPGLPEIPSGVAKWAFWVDLEIGAELTTTNGENRFLEAGIFPIHVDTIHGVKGQTHHATLVLETFHYKHDLQQIIPYLAGTEALPRSPGPRLSQDLRRLFVAMSRAKELLCLAIHADHVAGPVRAALESNGWLIEIL